MFLGLFRPPCSSVAPREASFRRSNISLSLAGTHTPPKTLMVLMGRPRGLHRRSRADTSQTSPVPTLGSFPNLRSPQQLLRLRLRLAHFHLLAAPSSFTDLQSRSHPTRASQNPLGRPAQRGRREPKRKHYTEPEGLTCPTGSQCPGMCAAPQALDLKCCPYT